MLMQATRTLEGGVGCIAGATGERKDYGANRESESESEYADCNLMTAVMMGGDTTCGSRQGSAAPFAM